MTQKPQPPLSTAKISWWHKIANPHIFMRLSAWILPFIWIGAGLLLLCALVMGYMAPNDRLQGLSTKIIYIHVPFAWIAMMCYSFMSVCALAFLIWRHMLADSALKSAAPIGALFTALALITGSIWGRPTWGTWWEWDARMTSVLILLLFYLAIIVLMKAIEDRARATLAAAILTLVGFINIPIIKFSVEWWNTLHQPASLLRSGGSAISGPILYPLLLSALGFTLLFFAFLLMSMRNQIRDKRIEALTRRLLQANRRTTMANNGDQTP